MNQPEDTRTTGGFSRVVAWLLLVVGCVFVYMAIKKIAAPPQDFLKQINQYGLFPLDPPHSINLTAVIVPWLELILGFALIFRVFLRATAIITGSMLAVFTVAIFVRALNFPDYVSEKITFTQIQFDCGCGAGMVTVWLKLLENSLMTLVMLPAVFLSSGRFTLFGRAPKIGVPENAAGA